MLLMLHLLSAVALVLVVALITTQFVAYQSFKDYDDTGRSSYHPLLSEDSLRGQPREGRASSSMTAHDDSSTVTSRGSDRHDATGGSKSLQGGRTGSKRVALAFYGLTRSLKFTIDTIKLNVMDQLKQAGYEYDVYLHTYDLKSLNNMRSGETGALNTTEWKLLSPDYVQIDDQDDFLKEYKLPIKACETFNFSGVSSASAVDYYEDNFKSYQNLLCQLNSIQQVTSMWRGSETEYDAVFYLRPDMLYNCPFPVHLLDNLRSDAVYIADFHHWHGYNDRFAFGRPETVGLWGERLQFALSTCMRQQIHAETLVSTLLDHYKLAAELIPFYFFRVRQNGLLESRDFKPRWKSFAIPKCDLPMFRPFEEREKRLAALAASADDEDESDDASERKSIL